MVERLQLGAREPIVLAANGPSRYFSSYDGEGKSFDSGSACNPLRNLAMLSPLAMGVGPQPRQSPDELLLTFPLLPNVALGRHRVSK